MSELHALTRPRDIVGIGSTARGGSTSMLDSLSLPPSGTEMHGVAIPAGVVESQLRTISVRIDEGDRESHAYRARIELGEDAAAAVLVRFEQGEAAEAQGVRFLAPLTQSDELFVPSPARTPLLLLNTALDIRLAAGAHLKLYVLSALGGRYFRETFDTATLGPNASLEWTVANFDAIDGIHSAVVELEGPQSALNFSAAYASRGRTEQEHILTVRHLAPRTKSRSTMKSALKESAHLIFRGLIRVDPKAQGTDAYLSNRNLILEDGARAESLPQLQIDTDDVACSHGATTGGPRPEELFYLMSRGLDREDAKRVLAQGHLGSIFSLLPEPIAEEFESRALGALSLEPDRSIT